ncbi:DUF2017 family protein [Ilumatobacter sp.]|uniref:DUF2017 family protein n=1 Tax=Ilumatobacter sp. TaxID=1967498 RepID=UPI003B51D839
MTRRFKPPIYASTRRGVTTWTLNLGDDERAVVSRLLAELRELVDEADAESESPLLRRLFPPAYTDHDEHEAEYQRLMREELVSSRLAGIDAIDRHLGADAGDQLDEGEVVALMQSLNAVRVVLGTMLDVGEDDDDVGEPGDEHEPERQLYGYLSWLVDWTVRSLQSTT